MATDDVTLQLSHLEDTVWNTAMYVGDENFEALATELRRIATTLDEATEENNCE